MNCILSQCGFAPRGRPSGDAEARDLLAVYQRDLGLAASLVAELSRPAVRAEYWDEMQGIASRAGVPIEEVVCGNLYYDALKAVLMASTAFAVDTPNERFTQETLTGGAKAIVFVDTPSKPNSLAGRKANLAQSAGPVL